MTVSKVNKIIFYNKQNIPWNEVEIYLKKFVGNHYINKEYQDVIQISGDFPNEFTESRYSKSLRGALAKVKANIAQIIDQLIVNATNRRWIENKDEKHNKNASEGWYRYDTHFEIPVQASDENSMRWNRYIATLVIRKNKQGLFLYDVINIKKEASTPL